MMLHGRIIVGIGAIAWSGRVAVIVVVAIGAVDTAGRWVGIVGSVGCGGCEEPNIAACAFTTSTRWS